MADTKEIVASASVDIGKNITELISRLADQMGTTADKVFPWYVKQQILEGWLFLISSGVVFCLGILFFVRSFNKAGWEDETVNKYTIICLMCVIVLLITLIIIACGFIDHTAQIINPQYYALKAMTSDMAKLLGH